MAGGHRHRDPPGPRARRGSRGGHSRRRLRWPADERSRAAARDMRPRRHGGRRHDRPPGTNAAPTSGFTGALRFPRLFWFLGLAGVLFTVISVWKSFGESITRECKRISVIDPQAHVPRPVRLALDAAIVAFGFIWVSWISPDNTWKGGVVHRDRLCARGDGAAGLPLRIAIVADRPARWLRPDGALRRTGLHAQRVSKYLNTIGAVPHDRTIGVLFCGSRWP